MSHSMIQRTTHRLRVSVDFSGRGKHKAEDVDNILAEARRSTRPDGSAWTHARYHHQEWIEGNRTYTNEKWGGDWRKALETLHTKGVRRVTSIVLRSVIVQASPAFFFPKIREEEWTQEMINDTRLNLDRGELDKDAVEKFWQTFLQFAQKEYGDRLLEAHLHVDEATPHIHLELLPVLQDGRLCNKEFIARNDVESRLFVDKIGKVGKDIGLERARPMTDEELLEHDGEYKSPLMLERLRVEKDIVEAEKIKEDIARLQEARDFKREEIYNEEIPEPFTKKFVKVPEKEMEGWLNKEETEESKRNRSRAMKYNKQLKEARDNWLLNSQKAVTTLETQLREVERDNNWKDSTINDLRQQVATMGNKIQQQRRDFDNVKQLLSDIREQISLHQILLDNGYIVDKKLSTQNTRIYRNEEDRKIGVTGQLFIDNHDSSFCGRGPIDLQMCLDGYAPSDHTKVKEAVAKLAAMYGIKGASTAVTNHAIIRQNEAVQNILRQEAQKIVNDAGKATWKIPDHDENKVNQAAAWLAQRGIDKQTIMHLLKYRFIRIDRLGNIVIPRRNGGYFSRGTYGQNNTFKRTIGGKEAGCAYIQGAKCDNKTLVLVESVTDAIAIASRFPTAEIAIIGGNMRPSVEVRAGQKVVLAFDQDEKGREHTQHYLKQYKDAVVMYPPQGKDWGEYIAMQQKTLQIKEPVKKTQQIQKDRRIEDESKAELRR